MKLKDLASLIGLELPNPIPKQEDLPKQEPSAEEKPSTKEEPSAKEKSSEKKPEKKQPRRTLPKFYKKVELESIKKDIELISELQDLYRGDQLLNSILAKAKKRLTSAAKIAKK